MLASLAPSTYETVVDEQLLGLIGLSLPNPNGQAMGKTRKKKARVEQGGRLLSSLFPERPETFFFSFFLFRLAHDKKALILAKMLF